MKHPQFAYALFQALLLNKIVDQAILQRMLEATGAGAVGRGPPPAHAPPAARPLMPVPPPHLQHGHLPPPSHYPPSQMPPFPPQGAIQQPQPLAGIPPPMQMSAPPASAMFTHHQHPQHMPPPMMPQYYRPPAQAAPVPPPMAPTPPQPPQQAPAQPAPEISDSQRVRLPQDLLL